MALSVHHNICSVFNEQLFEWPSFEQRALIICLCIYLCVYVQWLKKWTKLFVCLFQWLKKWIKKCNDDSETSNWIAANTKVCFPVKN